MFFKNYNLDAFFERMDRQFEQVNAAIENGFSTTRSVVNNSLNKFPKFPTLPDGNFSSSYVSFNGVSLEDSIDDPAVQKKLNELGWFKKEGTPKKPSRTRKPAAKKE